MKKLYILFFLVFFLISESLLAYSSNPKDFIIELVNDAIKKLSDKSLSIDEKSKFIEDIAINNVDINALSLYTLGELRKTAKEDDLKNYQKVFEKYFLKSLTSRLTDYSSSKFEAINSEQKSSNYTIVKSKIVPDNKDPEIKIDWRVYTKDPENPLIRDLVIEGLSLARTQKEEFNSIIANNDGNIEALFENLNKFIEN